MNTGLHELYVQTKDYFIPFHDAQLFRSHEENQMLPSRTEWIFLLWQTEIYIYIYILCVCVCVLEGDLVFVCLFFVSLFVIFVCVFFGVVFLCVWFF